MATNLLTVGTDTTPSSDVTLAEGETATLLYKGVAGGVIYVYTKDDTGSYSDFKTLGHSRGPVVVDGKVTFRVARAANGPACGVSLG